MTLSCDVVDFSSILSDSTDLSTCPQVKEIHSAFSTVGFVFLKNHGIEKKLVIKCRYNASFVTGPRKTTLIAQN